MSTQIKLNYYPRDAFRAFHNRTQRQAILIAHRRAGKTVAAVRDTEKRALELTRPDGQYAYFSPLLKQSKAIAWKYLKEGYYALKEHGAKIHESELKVTYPNGAEFRLYGADNPDAARGIYLDGAVLDEYAQMKPELLTDVILPALADRQGWLLILGTPKGRNQLYHMLREAMDDPDEWYHTILRASETQILPPSELQRLKNLMPENRYLREMECSFDVEDADQFISAESLAASLLRPPSSGGIRAIGVDPARFGDDSTAIVSRAGSVLTIEKYRKLDVVSVAGRTIEAIERFRPQAVFVDEIGLGGGVVDILRKSNISSDVAIIGVSWGRPALRRDRYADLRAECWDKMKTYLTTVASLMNLDNSQWLIDDATSVEYDYSVQGQLVIEAKEDLRDRGLPSPDIADALALTFAMPLMAAAEATMLANKGQEDKAAPVENPFDSFIEGNSDDYADGGDFW